MPHPSLSVPLLRPLENQPPPSSPGPSATRRALARLVRFQRKGRVLLSSQKKHSLIMLIVALDVVALLANVFVQLVACEMHRSDEQWVKHLTGGLEVLGLVFSSLFMVELAACLFSYGLSYLTSWFHLFDAAVIVASFAIDLATRGLAESIGSLVIVLRLWRLAKISEEVVVGATERLEALEQQMEELTHENMALRQRLGIESHEPSGQE
ncbi:uncharacterized protein UV8b_04848 [Ustilaginoidea virens]|uniref:Voltage-gated hydrogen channel 1 n=1 Tax=Ustilaginoidea virens TaxID=1159556 RepID=A0A1B5KXJ3_USTVR|nr:uncharacterized protein UV8b_04848 [Ustilaginoidea virens]QUC20607.1 hypothetical protein UV8b_04848 [Ustilaginoidea virens]GAO15329.1 hypothetical protein UVI_02041520 [Ustilaginoidea virens]